MDSWANGQVISEATESEKAEDAELSNAKPQSVQMRFASQSRTVASGLSQAFTASDRTSVALADDWDRPHKSQLLRTMTCFNAC